MRFDRRRVPFVMACLYCGVLELDAVVARWQGLTTPMHAFPAPPTRRRMLAVPKMRQLAFADVATTWTPTPTTGVAFASLALSAPSAIRKVD